MTIKLDSVSFVASRPSRLIGALVTLGLLVGTSSVQAAVHYDDLAVFASVLDLVRRNHVTPVDERELMESALRGLLLELDPHSAYMSPDDYEEMQVDTRGEFHGLGIEITKTQGGYIEVVSPIEGTPASRAGLKPHDKIVAICPTEVPDDWDEGETCRSTEEMTLFEAVQLMRGEKGTEISIDVFREDFEKPESYTIRRDVVQMASVEGQTLSEGFGLLRIRSFQERTHSELIEELDEIHSENPEGLSGLVIDVRDNPGGLLNQAVAVADHWVGDGLIVYTEGRDPSDRRDYSAQSEVLENDYPVVILVNEGSASASEILAGALQDNGRALVMGAPTFGKGSVQTVYPLDGGAGVRLTTALYYTPAGRSIQEVGIVPDIEVYPDLPQTKMQRRSLRERDLKGHFTHDEAEPEEALDSGEGDGPGNQEPGPDDESSETGADSDAILTRALEVLKSWSYFDNLTERRSSKSPNEEVGSKATSGEPNASGD